MKRFTALPAAVCEKMAADIERAVRLMAARPVGFLLIMVETDEDSDDEQSVREVVSFGNIVDEDADHLLRVLGRRRLQ